MKRRLKHVLQTLFRPPETPTASITQALREGSALYAEREDHKAVVRFLSSQVDLSNARAQYYRADYIARAAELQEARQMAGAGPWLKESAREHVDSPDLLKKLQESGQAISQGAYGDIELALQNTEWRREINLSWLEFSRWGIQQIILICRLYWLKNPIIRRLIDVCAFYVFGRGVEVSSPDEDANEVLTEFFARNKKVIGQTALMDLERRKYYDGNLFFVLFADKTNTGKVSIRTIDAVEIMDIVCDPDDTDTPWLYRRGWTERAFNVATGETVTQTREAWYPALGYEPAAAAKPKEINGKPVFWDCPVLHRKAGGVAKWHFGCPTIYPAIDWARTAKDYLTAFATVRSAVAQLAMIVETKGGQQAIEGVKQQMGTTVGPSSYLLDQNPPTVRGGIFASGPGTKVNAFDTRGAGGDPEEVRRFLHQCCMVVGVPETFLADVSTGNLATATTLDRPTELKFASDQECWIEDLTTIARYVLAVSDKASGGKLREARLKKQQTAEVEPEILVTFPAIREGDTPALVGAIVSAMTLNNKAGQVVGIDEKKGVLLLLRTLGVESPEEILEEMYPEKGPDAYDPLRTGEPEPALDPATGLPITPAAPGAPAANKPGAPTGKKPKASVKAIAEAAARLVNGLKVLESSGEDGK